MCLWKKSLPQSQSVLYFRLQYLPEGSFLGKLFMNCSSLCVSCSTPAFFLLVVFSVNLTTELTNITLQKPDVQITVIVKSPGDDILPSQHTISKYESVYKYRDRLPSCVFLHVSEHLFCKEKISSC